MIARGACGRGAIRFECDAAGAQAVHCFCTDCRKATGGAFATVVGFEAAKLRLLAGSPKSWVVTGTSGGRVERQQAALRRAQRGAAERRSNRGLVSR
ncbi:MAG: GFA family protein [Deltaproteobacteria bacterium]|nr:GFA family protein [Deltaproteobacteria bacterium]